MAVIRVEDIGFRYGHDGWVLRGVTLEVRQGDFTGIIGPNGSGKTTLLRVIDGILPPQEGAVYLDGVPVGKMKRDAVARMIAVVPQETAMVFPFAVQEVVLMGRAPHLKPWEFERGRDLQIARRAMERTALRPRPVRARVPQKQGLKLHIHFYDFIIKPLSGREFHKNKD